MDDFVLRALIAGLLVVLVSGPLGCVVVWRRMAYFGDTLAHAALLGTALSLSIELSPMFGVIFIGLIVSLLLVILQRKPDISTDTLLGIFAHGSLALGLVFLALMQNQGMRVDLMAYLFGDILAVSQTDIMWMFAVIAFVFINIKLMWRSLLSIAVHEELARSEGVAVDRVRLKFMLLIALIVAVAMKVVGILLITALLIIPAASARRYANSPESMAFIAVLFGIASILLGVFASMQWDSPTGPSIVVASVLGFFITRISQPNYG